MATLALFGLAGAFILGVRFLGSRAERGAAQARLAEADFAGLIASGHRVGARGSPAVLVVYNDYRCGFCAELDRTLEVLRARYPQHLDVVWKHFADPTSSAGRHYLVPQGAECAGEQDYFEEYHAAAFSNSRALGYADGAWLIARAAGVPDSAMFRQCVDSRRAAKVVEDHYGEAQRLGISATPTMFLNGLRINGTPPFEVLDSLIVREFPR
jgi:protein-disulfide isomerase